MVGVGEGYFTTYSYSYQILIRKKIIEIGRVVSEECDNKHRNKVFIYRSCLGSAKIIGSLTPGNLNGTPIWEQKFEKAWHRALDKNSTLYNDLNQSWHCQRGEVYRTRPRSLETPNKQDLSQQQISLEYIKDKQLSSLTIHPRLPEHPLGILYHLKRSPGLDTWLIFMRYFLSWK